MNKTIRHFLFIVGLLFAFTGQFSQAKESDAVRDLPTLGSYGSLSLVTGENKSLTPSAAPTNAASITAYTSGANSTNFSGMLTVDPTTGVVSVTNAKPAGTYTVEVKATSLEGSSTTTFTLTVSDPESSDGCFRPNNDYVTGSAPNSVAIGDFNRDGKQDLVVANVNSNSISILLGNGAGGFGAKTDYPTNGAPVSVAVGDLTGDGAQDIVLVTSSNNSRVVYVGRGNGDFYPPIISATGDIPISVVIGDFNRDGKQDFAVANFFSNSVSIHLNIGALSYSKTDFSTGENPLSVTIGDFNRDGWQDLATANSNSNTVSVLLGNGDGSFQAKADFGTDSNPQAVTVGDFNSDGYQDLAVANGGSKSTSVLLGDGAGSFGAKTDFGTAVSPRFVSVGDFNGDGNQDLAVTNGSSNTVSILLGNGTGIFEGKTDFETGTEPRSVAVGDFNGDGKQDLAVVNFTSNNVSVLLGVDPTPTLGTYSSLTLRTGENKIHTPSAAPTNTELLTAYTTGANATDFTGTLTVDPLTGVVSVTNAKPAGTYTVTIKGTDTEGASITSTFELTVTEPVSSTGIFGPKRDWGTGDVPISTVVGDFNKDGNQDLAVANLNSNTVSLMLGRGTGFFVSKIDFETGLYPSSVTVGDFNSDGKQDLAVTNTGSNTVSILLGNGMESFASKVDFETGNSPRYVSVGDFDQDGNQDLVVANGASGSVSILLGDGKGGFGTKTDFEVGSYPGSLTVGDFNGDSLQDLAVANEDEGSVSILLGDGVGGFAPKYDLTGMYYPTSIAKGDFNGDGKQDLVVTLGSSKKVSVLLGDGMGDFIAQADLITASFAKFSSVGDFNGDGNQDLAVANSSTNNVSVFLGDGEGNFGPKSDFGTSNASNSLSVGDFNGDGMQDLAVANGNSNTVSFLLGTIPPTLGSYGSLTVQTGENKVHTPSVAPTNTATITAYTSGENATNFSGILTVDPVTGVLSVTNAKQAGTFTVTVQATSEDEVSVTSTFELTVTDPVNSSGGFGPKEDYGVGVRARSVAIGDFNGDGKQDLAVANGISDSISILLGNGSGEFGAKTDFETGELPHSVTVGDFNGDGKQDIAVANYIPDNVSILLGDGAGSFGAKTDFPTGTDPLSVSVGDFNGDGNQDLAVANAGTDNVSILLGDGAGSFGAKTDFGILILPSFVAVGDFNRDGNQDLAVAAFLGNEVSILLGDGNGGFGPKTDFETGVGPAFVSVGDFNGDGNQDLATANLDSNTVSILLGNGAGAFGPKTDFETGVEPGFVSVGDFNGDGNQDLATANTDANTVSILSGNGAGAFVTKTDFSTGSHPISIAVGNFNGDGVQDLAVVAFEENAVNILLGDNTPTLGTYAPFTVRTGENKIHNPSAVPTNTASITAYTSGDNATNFLGILTVDPATGAVTVTNAKQAGTYTVTVQATNSKGVSATKTFDLTITDPVSSAGEFSEKLIAGLGFPKDIVVGDFNGDGIQDLALAISNRGVRIMLGDGEGGFTEKTELIGGYPPYRLAIGDFNGDGIQDLIHIPQRANGAFVRLGDGTGNFGPVISIGNIPDSYSVAVGDFNEDGKQDFAVAITRAINIWLGDGKGGFADNGYFITGEYPFSVSIGDFNGDGRQDLATANSNSATVSILLGDGTGSFGEKTDFNTGSKPGDVSIGDFNKDGKQDLAVTNYGSNTVSILIGNGTGGFGTKTDFGTGLSPNSVSIGDFNGDGKQDLAVTNYGSNTVSILLGDGAGSFGAKTDFGTGTTPYSVSVGDFNGDGVQDISVPNYTTSSSPYPISILMGLRTITGLTFEDASFEYDGTEKSLSITGELPEGTNVVYTNNGRTDVGTQTVTATISGNNYSTLVLTANLTVFECTTEVDFDVSELTDCANYLTVFLTDQSLDADSWFWEFGDGRTSSAQHPIHSYTSFGDFTVRLTASNSETGCSSIMEKVISFQPLSADFTANTTFGCGPLTVDFEDLSQGATTWTWDFGDGTTSTEQNPSHTYQSSGRFTVTLSVNRGSRCTDTRTISNYIQVLGPEVEFTSDETEGCGPLTVSFTDQTSASAPFISFAWDFGDGQTSNQQNPTHTYANAGIFTVSLTVRDLDGCSRTLTKADLIRVDALDFEFTDLNDVSCFDGADGTVTVQVSEGTEPYSYLWSNEQTSATATGLKEGTYSVTVTDANGCQKTKEITISAPAQPTLETDPANQITATTAVLGGSLSSGLDCAQEVGVVYGLTSDPTVSDTKVTMDLDGDSFSNTISNLVINTTYFVRSYSINQNGYISYGGNQSFTTLRKVLEVKVEESQSKVFGESDPILRFTVSGFEGTDDKSILSGELKREVGEDVGFFPIRLGTLDAGPNYTIEFTGADFEIGPATINGLTFEAQSFVFDGTEKSLSIQGILPSGTSVVYTNNGRTDVGTQEVTATITGDNYTELVLKANLTINPANISNISFEAQSFVFDGTEKSLAITGTLPSGTSVAYINNGRTDVGTQEVTATITGSNFTTLVLTADLTITPAELEGITFADAVFVFDGTAKSLAIGSTLPAGTSVSYANNSRTNVGTQEVTATITGSNFTTLVLTADLTITPAELEGITFADAGFVFDGTAKSLAIGGTLPEGTSVSYANNSRTNVGTQEVTATISGSNFTTLVLTADLTITPAELEGITFADASFVFDGIARSLAIQGTLPDGTLVAYTNNSRTNVGTQEVTATITGSNFTTLVLTADLTITPAELEGITFADAGFVFDGTAKSLAIGGTLPAGTSVSYANNSRTNVGTQEVTATITGSNFTTLVLTADLTITPAELEGITFADAVFVFDGTAKSLAIGGTIPEGTSVSYANNSRTNVGTQEVTATISGSNFTTLVLTADLTITPATITGISFADAVFVFDGTKKSLAIGGTLPAGTSVSYANNSRTNVGTQEVTATISGSNFTTLVLTADLTITPATITGITFADADFVFDGTAKSLVIGGTLPAGTSVSYANNSRTNVGTQEVTATISGSNFTTLVLTADLTITPAELEGITFEDETFVFDGTAKSLAIGGKLPSGTSVNYTNNFRTNVGTQEVTATISGSNFTTLVLTADLTITPAELEGITFGDAVFVFDGTAKSLAIGGTIPEGTSVSYANNSRTNVGTQEVTATITGSNFTTLVLTADLTITPAELEGITIADAVFVFDGTPKSLAIGGTIPEGTSVSYANNSRTNVGTQEVTATITGSNFTTLVLTADLTVSPAELIVKADEGQSKLFGEDDPELIFTATGYGAGDNESVFTGALVREAGEAVGFYAISQGNLDAGENYAISFTGGSFEIITNDSDEDGVPDDVEEKDGTDLKDPTDFKDSDGDGVPDFVEKEEGTDPNDLTEFRDSDGDGVPDYVEERDDTDPNDPGDFRDEDGDGVPSYTEDQEGTNPTDPLDYRDEDGDAVPDYVEDIQGTDPTDAGDYVDTDGDDVPDYVEEQQGTDPDNGEDFLDADEDGVPDYVQARSVTEFVTQSLEALWGIESGDLKVPTEAIVITASGEFINLPVTWNLMEYDPMVSGANVYTGMVELPAGIFNPNELQPTLEITVLAKPVPQDVALSANSFIGIPDQYFQQIGAFTVIDPTDNVHTLSLPEGVQDNKYFEVLDGILFWSSDEQAPGRTEFTVLLRVEDRGGNVFEKSFQITRTRTPLDQLDVPNTFTPNGDGTNDTWGVIALRYYIGVKISIMSVGGERVFYTENPDKKWDGIFNGNEMPVGAYLYVIEVAETGEIRRGMLNLLRH
ncbi:gliding motility-associated C-terminal domain-containing protein [Algoriphagus locisalis]|uniref:Gliding motility-associated C-terminal domain-containing protein n=1 Tax=Algoriphagus locisalis TaxID=305507 RepID=A0A1I7BCE6_9BACT|nr:FG-GAP-like repeat-containing protein [Algoriphagus locisalis]SFT84890.1 gliding motility-associated C-terminal domain-containing protein [Algoriphagus locisalis]